MRRALLPWLFPVLLMAGLLIAATGSPIVWGLALIVAGWVALPLALSAARRSGNWPRSLGGDQDAGRGSNRGFLPFGRFPWM
ncbi:MAG TPA: hypothetical protein VG325_00830 [Solirubrobacteraceae bacterium]|jgi:hypothetical protein|nr:hypothetical protein [Solirubrobacteraceae bacterium]